MVGCCLIMAPTELERTQDMHNGTCPRRSHGPEGPGIDGAAPLFCGPHRDTPRRAARCSKPYAHKEGASEVTGPKGSGKGEEATRRGCARVSGVVGSDRARFFSRGSRSICDGFTSCLGVDHAERWSGGGRGVVGSSGAAVSCRTAWNETCCRRTTFGAGY